MDVTVLERVIKERRTIRQWRNEDVSDELIRYAVELATWAPNGGNYQGWHFTVVKNRDLIEEMANCVQSVVDRIAGWPEAGTWREEIQRYQRNGSFFRSAPVCMGVCAKEYESLMERVLKRRESFDPVAREMLSFRRSAPTTIQSAAAAVTTMLLAFHYLGLGACWLAAPLMAKREIENILKVPKNMALICLIAVGYPDESPLRERKPVGEVLEFIY
jgi:nitroreductase